MSKVWDDMYDVSSVNDIHNLITEIDLITKKGLAQEDLDDFENMKETLSSILNDLKLIENTSSCEEFKKNSEKLKTKYQDEDIEFDINFIINEAIHRASNQLDEKENQWRSSYLTLLGKTRPKIHVWEEQTALLSEYLSARTVEEYKKLKTEADEMFEVGRIEDVIYYFDKLQKDEKLECLKKLMERVNK